MSSQAGDGGGQRFWPEDLRRFAANSGIRVGLSPAQATALARHVLWHDMAGTSAAHFGLRRLPDWLERVGRREIVTRAECRCVRERTATAVVDGGSGPGPVVLARAAGMAVEKAREAGVSLIHVRNVGVVPSAAEVAAEIAIGPMACVIVGPRPSWTLAVPTAEGLPVVWDSDLASRSLVSRPEGATPLAAWARTLTPPPGNWLIAAISIVAMADLSSFYDQAGAVLPTTEIPGCLLPGPWAERRRHAHERGIALDDETVSRLTDVAERLGIPLPPPIV